MMEVLRLTHRIRRDPRLSSHVALTARAFLADKIYYSGDHDAAFESSINNTVNRFGGDFEILYVKDAVKFVQKRKEQGFLIVHLTAYGMRLKDAIQKIKLYKNVLIIVGSERVEPEYYELADYNVSITNQPISEVSALAVFLHEYFDGKELDIKFDNAKIIFNPSRTGKDIIKQENT